MQGKCIKHAWKHGNTERVGPIFVLDRSLDVESGLSLVGKMMATLEADDQL